MEPRYPSTEADLKRFNFQSLESTIISTPQMENRGRRRGKLEEQLN
jgi:hypothetical protein